MKRPLVFVGDYVNRGIYSKEVVDFLINLRRKNNCIFIKGNHDIALENYLITGNFPEFARYGGINTIKSYISKPFGNIHNQLKKEFPIQHIKFFKSLLNFYEEDNYFFSHAGINPLKPKSRELLDLCNNSSLLSQLENKLNNKRKIFGHFSLTKGVLIEENNICVDTGSGSTNGFLSCIMLPEEIVVSGPKTKFTN